MGIMNYENGENAERRRERSADALLGSRCLLDIFEERYLYMTKKQKEKAHI
jgi:hypothetical protein